MEVLQVSTSPASSAEEMDAPWMTGCGWLPEVTDEVKHELCMYLMLFLSDAKLVWQLAKTHACSDHRCLECELCQQDCLTQCEPFKPMNHCACHLL